MPKVTKPGYYAVKVGRSSGVFLTWDECEAQIKGYPGAKYKKFPTVLEAQQFIGDSPQADANVSSLVHPTTNENEETVDLKTRNRSPDIVDESPWDVVYTDGACKGNGRAGSIAGIGVWWGPDDERNIAERCPGDQTNNRAELIAIVRLLESTPITYKPLLIKSDSQYSINCFKRWLPSWIRNSFRNAKGEPVKNAGIIRYLSAHLDARAKYGQKIRLQYVKGHSGEQGNDGADAMANQGALLPATQERDWDSLEKVLRKKILDDNQSKDPHVMPLEIEGPDEDESWPVEEPSKGLKFSSLGTNLPEGNSHLSLPQAPVSVPQENIDFDLYADCLLDDDGLAKEMEDL